MKRNPDQWEWEFDYSDPRLFEEHLKEQFDDTRRARSDWEDADDSDLDARRVSRRMETAIRNVQYVKEMIGEDYPDFPGTSYFEQDWAYLSSLPAGYDAIDRRCDLITAAAVWILDRLSADNRLEEAERALLPEISEKDAAEISERLAGKETGFPDDLLAKTVYVLMHRNDDCKVYTPKGKKPRYILDEATVRGKNNKDVPSRQRFEKLIGALDPSEIACAEAEFREKYWFLARAFFAGLRENHARRSEQIKRHDRLIRKIKQYADGTVPRFPDEKAWQNVENVTELREAVIRCGDLVQEGVDEKTDYCVAFSAYLLMNADQKKELMTEELNERMKDFTIENPYRLAFALLYLADRNDDLIWMYYFGTALADMTGVSLPWSLFIPGSGLTLVEEPYYCQG